MSIESYYDSNAQTEWERMNRHRTEFAVTRRALAQYLPPPPARVFDCGGGPGRYAIHLAQQGYTVTLLDLSSGNLALARQKAQEAGVELEGYVHGNALDLSSYPDASFDAVLLLGPLYHLIDDADRRQAVREAVRVLKPGGPLFAGFITLYAPLRDAIAKGYLTNFSQNPAIVDHLLTHHTLNPVTGFTDAWFAHPAEVTPLMESCGLRTLALLAAEGLVSGHEQHINALNDTDFEFWAGLNYRLAADPQLLAAADHLLYIGVK